MAEASPKFAAKPIDGLELDLLFRAHLMVKARAVERMAE